MEREQPLEKTQPEIVRDMNVFGNTFAHSSLYDDAFLSFFQGKELDPTVTYEEMEIVFQQSSAACEALVIFSEQKMIYKYDPKDTSLSAEERQAIEQYIASVRAMIGVHEVDELEMLDFQRTQSHNELANALLENGHISSRNLGIILGRIILVQEGFESFHNIHLLANNIQLRGIGAHDRRS